MQSKFKSNSVENSISNVVLPEIQYNQNRKDKNTHWVDVEGFKCAIKSIYSKYPSFIQSINICLSVSDKLPEGGIR